MLRRFRVPRARVIAVLAVAGATTLTACSGDVVDGSGRLAAGFPASSSPAASVPLDSLSPSPAPTGSPATSATSAGPVSPSLDLVRKLRAAVSASWVTVTDPATATTFSLPNRVSAQQRTRSGVAQRVYTYQLTKQSGVSVTYVRTPSAAAAKALLGLYPQQLATSFKSLGADDAAVSEQRSTTVSGLPATAFRFAFTPTSVPQIKPVWLITAVASGTNVVLLQTVVFPANTEFDFVPLVRQAHQRLVASFRSG